VGSGRTPERPGDEIARLRAEVERLRATMRGGIDFWQTAEAEATQRAEVMTALVRELADVLASSPHFTAESPGDWEEQARAALARVGEMLGEEKKP